MKMMRNLVCRPCVLAACLLAAVCFIMPSATCAQNSISTSAFVDSEGYVEETLSIAANQTDIDGYVEVVEDEYAEEDEGITSVAGQVALYDGSTLVGGVSDGSEYDNGPSEVFVAIHLGDTYTLYGWSYACYGEDESGDPDNGCSYEPLDYLTLTLHTGAPSISSISPTSGTVGTSGSITVNGDNLVDAFGVSNVSITGGVSASIASGESASQATVDYQTLTSSEVGQQTLTISNSFGASNGETFTVGYPPATVTNISPSSWIAGNSYSVTITGQNFGTAPTVSLSGSGVTVSGVTPNPNGQSITATVTVAANAPNESVTVSVQPGYTGSSFTCACNGQPEDGTDTASVVENLPTPTISIQNNGTNAPFAGQPVSLTVSAPNGFTLKSQNWSFSNSSDAVANYIPSVSNGCYVPVTPSSGSGVCAGQTFSTTQANIGPFFFIVPGASETVTVNATYNMADNSTASAPVTSQTFTIQGPTAVNITTTLGTMQILPPGGSVTMQEMVLNGVQITQNGTVGIEFGATSTFPSNAGTYSWVQLLINDNYNLISSKGHSVCTAIPGGPELDNTYPYGTEGGNLFSTNGVKDDTATDGPSVNLSSSYGELSRSFNATMYLMWTPSQTNAIPIPLARESWSLRGDATNTLANQSNGTQWALNGCSNGSSGGCVLSAPSTDANQSYPVWGSAFTNGSISCAPAASEED